MKRLAFLVIAATTLVASLAVRASGSMSMSAVGAGPSGYDWLVGTWSRKNTMPPSKLGALQSSTFTAAKLKDGNIVVGSAPRI